MELRTAIQNLQAGQIAPVYLLQGDDYYLQQFLINRIEQAFFAGTPVDRQLLLPEEIGGRETVEALTRSDLFSSRKLFTLRNAQQLREPHRRQFLDYCKNPILNHCLIVIDDESGNRLALMRDLAELVDPVSTAKPFESELRKWVIYFFKENQVQVSEEIVGAVLDVAGDSVYHIANEVIKICLELNAGDQLTVESVHRFAGWRREYRQWEFMTAVGSRNLDQALLLGKALLSQGISLINILYQLATLFQEILLVQITAGTSPARGGYIPLSPSVRKRLGAFSKRYNYGEVERALGLLGEIDRRIKTTTTSDESELTVFLFRAVGGDG
ncbi:MAG: DNA polymerase III subunit delta [Candidatus Neomarinimicrobiota bacterium]